MTAIEWDQVGDRIFEVGVDHGVLYLSDRSGVAWNGLRSVIETTSGRVITPHHYDGVKYADSQTTGEFVGTLTALTYPDEFLFFEGAEEYSPGIHLKNQFLHRFHLCYRSRLGNDVDALEYGYKLHILYNLLAVPRDTTHTSIGSTVSGIEFSWSISAVPEVVAGFVPTSHVVLDSRKVPPKIMRDIEEILYGNSTTAPYLPTLVELKTFIDNWVGIKIIDNGDGTWTAQGSESFLNMLSSTEFRIVEANATYLSPDTFEVSTGTE